MDEINFSDRDSIARALEQALTKDRFRLTKQFRKFGLNWPDSPEASARLAQDSQWQTFCQQLTSSIKTVSIHQQAVPKIRYESLPVADRREEISSLIQKHQVVVIAGETGSGKTTQIPKICLEAGRGVFGRIGCTQPRRLAARSVAERLAEELGSTLGQLVGYQVRFHDQVHAQSLVKVMTDGILLAEVQNDPYFSEYDTIIIDEAHERSINIDFLLGILKNVLPKRPDLKLIITSATIDTQRFAEFFEGAPIIEVSGRTYPVEVRYRPLTRGTEEEGNETEQDIPTAIADALQELEEIDPFGDVLVFQVGERDIKETAEALRKQHLKNTEIVPLYARLSMAEQNKVFQISSKRRVILSTNVAETSLTVPGIKFVIDPGLVRISRYSVRSKVQRLPIEKISQASANQRAGRCGRVSSGVCIRLYEEEDYNSRAAFTPPEIHRTALATVILQMTQMKLGSPKQFPFIEPPEDKAINDGFRQLQEIGAINEKRQLTTSGHQLAKLPLDPRMAKMVLEGQQNGVLTEVLVIATAMSIQDPRAMNESTRQAAQKAHQPFEDTRSDFLFFLNLWRFYEDKRRHLSQSKLRKLCKTNFLSYMRMKEWHDLFYQLEMGLKRMGMKVEALHLYEEVKQGKTISERLSDLHSMAVHRSLMVGLLGNIAMRDDEKSYLGARSTKLFIHPSSTLFKQKPKWMISGELVETTKLYARNNAVIDVNWIEGLAPHLIRRQYSDPHWQKKSGQVGAFESVTLYGLPIINRRRCNYGPVNPVEARKIFLRQGLVDGEINSKVDFLVHNQRCIEEIHKVESKLRRPDFLVEETALYDFYDAHVPAGIYSQPAFEKWVKTTLKNDPDTLKALYLSEDFLLKQSLDSRIAVDYPDQLQLKNQLNLAVDYRFEPGKVEDGMVVNLPLSALNLVQAADFEWLTPGLLKEKTACYIKALPKALRKQFIPAPQTAEQVLTEMTPDKSLDGRRADYITQLVWALNRRAQQRVTIDDFGEVPLAEHLKPYFILLDDQERKLAENTDLEALKSEYQHLVDARIQKHQTQHVAERQMIDSWDFGDLADSKTFQAQGMEMVAYPALKKVGDQIELALVGDAEQAQKDHGEAVFWLIKKALQEKERYLQKKLPMKQACLCFAPYGACQALTQQIIDRALMDWVGTPEKIRKQADFEQVLELARVNWVDNAQALAKQVTDILSQHQKIAKQIKGKVPPRWLASVADIHAQLDGLIGKNFVMETPQNWFKQLPRYLQGIEKRLQKIDLDPTKDQKTIREIQPVLEAYQALASKSAYQFHPGLVEIRWLIEELRLSLFAQPMKTLKPVSIQRLQKKLQAL